MRSLLFLMLFIPLLSIAQNKRKGKVSYSKGTLFAEVGLNKTNYLNNSVQFQGIGYDFTLANGNPKDNIIGTNGPQIDAKIGYYIEKHWALNLGYNRINYRYYDNGAVTINGKINPGVDPSGYFSGSYVNQLVSLDSNQFVFANEAISIFSLGLTRTDHLFALGSQRNFLVSSNIGANLGALVSNSTFNFAGKNETGTTSLSGISFSGNVGLRFEFFKKMYLLTNFTTGYHNQFSIRTREAELNAKAIQGVWFTQFNAAIGMLFYIRPTNDCSTCPVW